MAFDSYMIEASTQERTVIGLLMQCKYPTKRLADCANEEEAFHGEFLAALRKLVDDWIASGKTPGGERPWERVAPPEILEEVKRHFPPQATVAADGRMELQLTVSPDHLLRLSVRRRARLFAGFHFAKLISSSSRERLSRCDTCGAYFERQRMPKRGVVIRYGVHCPKCKGSGSLIRVRAERDRRRRTLVELAAGLWSAWSQKQRRSGRSEWVAAQMNRRLPPGVEAVDRRWVTRNQEAIRAAVEQNNHMESRGSHQPLALHSQRQVGSTPRRPNDPVVRLIRATRADHSTRH